MCLCDNFFNPLVIIYTLQDLLKTSIDFLRDFEKRKVTIKDYINRETSTSNLRAI